MIKLMVVGFSPIGTDASLGNRRRVWEKNCLVQLQGSEMSPGLPQDWWLDIKTDKINWRLDIKAYKIGYKNCVNRLALIPSC